MSESNFKNLTKAGSTDSQGFCLPFSLGCTQTRDSTRGSRTLVMIWTSATEKPLFKSAHFSLFFDCRRVSARQMTALTPSSTARRGGETCTQRRDAKRWVRAVKLNGEHLRLLRAGQQQEPCLAMHQGTNTTWNSNKRGRWFDSISKALSTPPHKPNLKSISAFKKETSHDTCGMSPCGSETVMLHSQ